MISKGRTIIICLLLYSLLNCNTGSSYKSPLPESEQSTIREILNKNGYNLSEEDLVDQYIGKVTDYHTGTWYGEYNLIIPKDSLSEMILTDNINNLNRSLFSGHIAPPEDLSIDTIVIISDSFINIPGSFSAGRNLKHIPKTISKLKTRFLNFRNNHLSTLPEEIMLLTSQPFPFDTFAINITGNPIDSSLLSDTLQAWLDRYSTFVTVIP